MGQPSLPDTQCQLLPRGPLLNRQKGTKTPETQSPGPEVSLAGMTLWPQEEQRRSVGLCVEPCVRVSCSKESAKYINESLPCSGWEAEE